MPKPIQKILSLLAIPLLLLSVVTPFLHNHQPDFSEHEDCPVHVFEVGLSALVWFFLLWLPAIFYPATIFPIYKSHKSQSRYDTFINKAPPLY